MDAKICDRCGIFYVMREATLKLERPAYKPATADNGECSYYDKITTIDICPECVKSFEKWLKNESEE